MIKCEIEEARDEYYIFSILKNMCC